MSTLDERWPAIARTLTLRNAAPERFFTSEGCRSLVDEKATLEEVRAGFDILEQALLTLGPRTPDEPLEPWFDESSSLYQAMSSELDAMEHIDVEQWREVFARWARAHPAEAVIAHPGVTWTGIAQLYARMPLARLGRNILRGVREEGPDPRGTRALALERVPELILLQECGRGSFICFMLGVLQDDAMPLAAEIYHHPTTDLSTRSTIEHNVLPGDMDYILSHAPKTHRKAPWRDPE